MFTVSGFVFRLLGAWGSGCFGPCWVLGSLGFGALVLGRLAVWVCGFLRIDPGLRALGLWAKSFVGLNSTISKSGALLGQARSTLNLEPSNPQA